MLTDPGHIRTPYHLPHIRVSSTRTASGAGNGGPGWGTHMNPADMPSVLGVGALGATVDEVATPHHHNSSISAYLGVSRRISAYLGVSRQIESPASPPMILRRPTTTAAFVLTETALARPHTAVASAPTWPSGGAILRTWHVAVGAPRRLRPCQTGHPRAGCAVVVVAAAVVVVVVILAPVTWRAEQAARGAADA